MLSHFEFGRNRVPLAGVTFLRRNFASRSRIQRPPAFTLIELLVVIAIIAVLAAILLPALAAAKERSRRAFCMNNVHQIEIATVAYASDFGNKLPVLQATPGLGTPAWAWDLPATAADNMLNSGVTKQTFYCPGTQPKFTDWENFQEPGTDSRGNGYNLWDFDQTGGFHIVGYALAFSGTSSLLKPADQNTTILPEKTPNPINSLLPPVTVSVSDRVLVADTTISDAANPPYSDSKNNFTSVAGYFEQPTTNPNAYTHTSPHLKGLSPAGGNVGFKDGHVQWRKFQDMLPRTASGKVFWW